MIVSRRGLWAAAPILISLGGQSDAAGAGNLERRQPPNNFPTPSGPPGSRQSSVYFTTDWAYEPGDAPYALDTLFAVSYTVKETNPALMAQGSLGLLLLWTSATAGTPGSDNTWEIAGPKYQCDSIPNTGICSYAPGKTGVANITLQMNPNEVIPQSDNGLMKNLFFCLATGLNAPDTNTQCESYSSFFDVNITSQNPPTLRERDNDKRQDALTPPTSVLAISSTRAYLIQSGLAPLLPPTTASSPVTTAATPTASSSSNAGNVVTIFTPTGTTTVLPSPTISAVANEAQKSKSSPALPTGAIAGIAVGGFLILLILALILFFCYRRRQRKRAMQPEQVLLTQSMNHSRDMMAEKHTSDAMLLPTSILDQPRPASESYNHLSVSAPYTGRVGPTPRRTQTATTLSSTRTAISRGISDASAPSPRSGMFEEYHDEPVPVYGDARHVPQVYTGAGALPIPAPFLSEPGMTDEELTRLEEEERRIDEAILEAERQTGRR